jgi:hypothetical protein
MQRGVKKWLSLVAPLGLALVSALAADAKAFAQDKKNDDNPFGKTPLPKPGLHINGARAFRGYTLFGPLNSAKTFLIDMEGKVAHSWDAATRPGASVYLLPSGNLFRPCEYTDKKTSFGLGGGNAGRIQEFTWDGALVWDYIIASDRELSHHDAIKLPNGNVLVIVSEAKSAEEAGQAGRKPAVAMRSDSVYEIKPTGKTTGEIVWQWRTWDHLIQDADKTKSNFGDVTAHPELCDVNYPSGGKTAFGRGVDWMHTNGIDYNPDLDQIMLSVHNLHEFWIIDHGTTTAEAGGHASGKRGKGGDILYRWGNPQAYRAGGKDDRQLFAQHNSHWIAKGLPGGGHALVFNNGSGRPGGTFSSADEVAMPVDAKGNYTLKPGSPFGPDKALWSYAAPKKGEFYSPYISGAQRLRNGNTLICSGADGTFFEVTPDKEIVWKYVNPVRTGGLGALKAGGGAPTPGAVFRAYRYAANYPGLAGRKLDATMAVEEYLAKKAIAK